MSSVDLKALLEQMTLEEKIGQMIQLSAIFFDSADGELTGPAQEWDLDEHGLSMIGSCIGGLNAKHKKEIQDRHLATDRNKIPLIFMRDIIHGYRTIYPIPLAMAGSFDPSLMEECAHMAAREASHEGTHLTFAPMVDFVRDARWGRVAESCGEDALLASKMGEAQVKGFQKDDISSPESLATCVKHFAAYGGAEAGRDYNTVEISERLLRSRYLPAYKACIDAGTTMVMPSFNNLNGLPSVGNKFLMKKILRDEWGFEGVVISDWEAIYELCVHGVARDLSEAAEMALDCSCDIEMVSRAYYDTLADLVRSKRVSEDIVDRSVMRILELKKRLGLFEDPYHGSIENSDVLLCPEHKEIAERAALESAVLLRNNGILPLNKNIKRLAVVGPFANSQAIKGTWAAMGENKDCISVLDGLKALLPNTEIKWALGCEASIDDPSKDKIAQAVEICENADAVILCVGEPQGYSGEAQSRVDISLPGVQDELIDAVTSVNSNTVALVFNGRPLTLVNLEKKAAAILEMWHPGTQGGLAAAKLILGMANPCGKLPMTFPKHVGQCPIYYDRTRTGRPKKNSDDKHEICVSDYLDCGDLPLFFFGEGLSYSNFVYESMVLDKNEITKDDTLKVSVTVRNDSDTNGKEVVQLYLCDLVASAVRPVQELIAFEKIALAAGERKTLDFFIREDMLRFYDSECRYISEPGDFTLSVGYADHMRFTQKFTLI